MTAEKRVEKLTDVDRIFLDLTNPRHDPFKTQQEAIDYLCRHENVLQLARDIKKHGLNPLERFAVTRLDRANADTKESTYVVAEGNRRLCALMLLNDPDLAPSSQVASYEKLSEGWAPIEQIPCVIFEDQEELNLWLERTHQGVQGGIGRKPWDAVQKQRHSGNTKNRVALAILEYGKQKGMISAKQEKGKLTTIQRYVGNPVVRASLGIDSSNPDELFRTNSAEDFELLMRKFFTDLLGDNQKITSRANKSDVEKYAHELNSTEGQSRQRVEPAPILEDEPKIKKSSKGHIGKNAHRKRLPFNADLSARLKGLNSWKLNHLHTSICNVPLQENAPLLAIGVWSLIECLTARAGRDSNTDFYAFLSIHRLQAYGLGDGKKTRTVRDVVSRVQTYGNTTKHDDTAAAFNGDQLANDLEVLAPLLIKIAEEAVRRKPH